MTSTARLMTLTVAAALALGLSACTAETPAPATSSGPSAAAHACSGEEGVTVVVDASATGDAASQTWCYLTDAPAPVAQILPELGIQTEGTAQFGDQVLCRVNGVPSASAPVGSTEDPGYVESCEAMPAAFAYWSLWVKPAGGGWDYAQEGLATLTAKPGESVALLFTLDGAPAAPTH